MTPFHQHAITNPTAWLVVFAIEVALFGYFVFVNLFYLATTLTALSRLPRFVRAHLANPVVPTHSELQLPVTVAVPAYNEEAHIVQTVHSLLNLDYARFEVVVVNDGSTDGTLGRLAEAFALVPLPQPYRVSISTQPVREIYISERFPNLRVIDKLNGGKGDALNTALNCARYPLFFATDADSHYSRDALQCMAEPFLRNRETVVCGAAIGVENGCEFANGIMIRRRLSKSWVVRFQILEYMRAFLSSRLGWAPLNALMIISGACGLWQRNVLLEAGGYRTDTVWEDLEMTTRVHHMLRKQRRRYRVAFTPFAVCWTTVPATLRELWNQRVGWQRHISEAASLHRKMFLGRGCGTVGWLGFPYLVLGECIAPVMVIFGTVFTIVAAYFGFLWLGAQAVLLGLVAGLAILISMAAIFLDEISFKTYSARELVTLLLAAPLELLGYRAFITLANFVGIWHWLISRPVRGRHGLPSWNARPYDPLYSPNWRV